jgi:hypothetical protein
MSWLSFIFEYIKSLPANEERQYGIDQQENEGEELLNEVKTFGMQLLKNNEIIRDVWVDLSKKNH